MRLILSQQRWLRFSTFTAFYFAQGVPIGLFSVALPAFMAAEGSSVGEIAAYTGTVSLPWALKLFAGPIMDRFTFLAMGFRRPWVIFAQTGLVVSLLVLAVASTSGDPSIFALTWFGFCCNVFSASQDVATDGMAIELLPEDERGRANAFMALGQALGFSSFGAVSGFLLVSTNISTVAVTAAVTILIIWAIAILVRERPGEKMLPWTPGKEADVVRRKDASFRTIFWDLLRTICLPMSLLLILMEFVNRANDGIGLALFPTYATQALGVEPEIWTSFVSIVGFVAAFVGLVIGVFIDWLGVKRMLIIVLLLGALLRLIAWIGVSFFDFGLAPLMYLYIIASFVGQCIFVATIAIFMTICLKRISATQFSVYMSLANLSRTIGAFLYGLVSVHIALHDGFLIMAVLLAIGAIATMYFFPDSHAVRIKNLEAEAS